MTSLLSLVYNIHWLNIVILVIPSLRHKQLILVTFHRAITFQTAMTYQTTITSHTAMTLHTALTFQTTMTFLAAIPFHAAVTSHIATTTIHYMYSCVRFTHPWCYCFESSTLWLEMVFHFRETITEASVLRLQTLHVKLHVAGCATILACSATMPLLYLFRPFVFSRVTVCICARSLGLFCRVSKERGVHLFMEVAQTFLREPSADWYVHTLASGKGPWGIILPCFPWPAILYEQTY